MLEYVREAKTHPFLRSVYAELITQPMGADIQIERQIQSYSFGESIDLSSETAPKRIILWQIPQGYHYHLEGLRVWQQPLTDGNDSPPLYFELFADTRNRNYNDQPIAIALDTTPAPGNSIRYRVRNHCTLAASSVIKLTISGYTIGQPTLPERVEVMTEGLKIPIGRVFRSWQQ